MDLDIQVHARRLLPSAVPWISEDRLLCRDPVAGHSVYTDGEESRPAHTPSEAFRHLLPNFAITGHLRH